MSSSTNPQSIALSSARPTFRRRAHLALSSFVALATIIAGVSIAAPAVAAENGTLTLEKQVVLDAGVTNPGISNIAGVPGTTFQYQIAYSCNVNSGFQCEDIVIVDAIPAELEIAASLPANWTVVGNEITIPIGTIGAGGGTISIPVRFVTDPALAAYDEVTVPNTATATYAVGGELDDAVSNTVDVTGIVTPIGGVTASKTVAPTTAQEFTNTPVTVTLGATNAGTTAGAISIVDVDADFFDAFALTSVSAPTLPAGSGTATVETWDGTVWSPLTVPFAGSQDVGGLRLLVDGVPAGAGVSLEFRVALRDTLLSGGPVAATGASSNYRNDVATSIAYSDPSLDSTAAANATVQVNNTFAGTPRLTKSVAPTSVIVGQDTPVTFTLTSAWTAVGQGGLSSISITDPDPLGSATSFDYVDPTSLVVQAWPATIPAGAAQQVTVITNCGTAAPVAGAVVNTTIALPCAGSAITSVQFLFEPTAPGAVYANNASAAVRIVTEIEDDALSTPGSFQNDARIDVASAPDADVAPSPNDLEGTNQVPATVNFSINEPQFQVTVNKNYAQPNSFVRNNVVLLPTRVVAVPSNATVDRLVIQDPSVLETDATAGTDFFDQYEITQLRSPSCPAGYSLAIEVLSGGTWSALTPPGLATNFCASSISFPLTLVDDLGLTAAQQQAVEGIRFVYTNPTSGVSTLNVQPAFDIRWRDVNAETGAAQVLPARTGPGLTDVEPPIPSAGNCPAAEVFTGSTSNASDVLVGAECPVVSQTAPPPTGGTGGSVAKTVTGNAGAADPQAQAIESLNQTFVGTFALWQDGSVTDTEFLRVTDPVSPATVATGTLVAGYDPAVSSQIFASITNVTRVTTTSGIPLNEKAVLEAWDPATSSWVVLQTIPGNGTNNINRPFTATEAATYGGWRITLEQDENNLAGDIAPGFIDPQHFTTAAPLRVTVGYELRDTFRTAVSVHAAGDPVLYNLCYGVDAVPLTIDPMTGLVNEPCALGFGPPSQAEDLANYAGYVINDASATLRGVPANTPTEPASTNSSFAVTHNVVRDLQILGTDANVLPTKTFRRDAAGATCGTIDDETVAIPVDGVPADPQERIVCLDVRNEYGGALDMEIIDDSNLANGDFWSMFALTGATVTVLTAGGAVDATYSVADDVRFDLQTTGAPLTGLTVDALNALSAAQLATVTRVTVHAEQIPGGDLLRVELGTILRPSVTTPAGVINDFSVEYTKDGVNSETESDGAAIAARSARYGVMATKSVTLAPGEINAVDLTPMLNVTVGATNAGDLGLDSLRVEDDDAIATDDYGPPTVPATLPSNTEDFWANVEFGAITGITFPAGADEAIVETLVGGTWTTVGTFPAGSTGADVQAAITSPSAVTGIRATFSASTPGGIPIDAVGRLDFTVSVRATAVAGVELVNTAEAGMSYVSEGTAVDEYQNPAQAAFTPQAGTLSVDIAKTTLTTTAFSGDAVRWTLRFTNTGQQTIGLHAGHSPLSIVDVLPTQLAFDPSIAAINAVYPAAGGTSTFADATLPAVAYDAATNTLAWNFDSGEGLGAGETIAISITLRVASAVPAATVVTNTAGIVMPAAANCITGDPYAAGRCTSSASITIASGGNLNGVKTIDTGSNVSVDPSISCPASGAVSFPCAGVVASGQDYTWALHLENSGNLPLSDAVLIDRLPAVGDTTIVGSFARGTEWSPVARGPVTATAPGIDPATLVVQYLPAGSPEACFAEITSGVVCADWVVLPTGTDLPLTAIGVRVAVPYSSTNPFQPGAQVAVTWSETAPASLNGTPDTRAANGSANPDGELQQWNNYSFRVRYAPTSFFSIDSVKAGAQFDTAALRITKQVDEDSLLEPADYGSFEVVVTCTVDGVPVVETVTIAHGETAELLGFPTGTPCVLSETDAPETFSWNVDEDASTPDAEVTITESNGEPLEVTVTNTYASQSVTVAKTVIGETSDAGYLVQVVCTYDGVTIDLPAEQAEFTLVPGTDVDIAALPVGTECTVTEVEPGEATATDAQLSIEDMVMTFLDETTVDVVVPDVDGTTVRFVNKYLADLAITKTVAGPAQAGEVYEVTLTEVGGDGDPIVVEISGGETVVIEDLPAGAAYAVVETVTGGADSIAYTGLTGGVIELEQGDNEVGVTNTFIPLQGTGMVLGPLPQIGTALAGIGLLLLIGAAWRRRRREESPHHAA